MKTSLVCAIAALILVASLASADEGYGIQDYNASLVTIVVPFYERYPASFYTGFSPRVEEPKRIHFRAARGNQVRLTAILDEYSVLSYLYSLRKRAEIYEQARSRGMIQTKSTSQVDAFRRVVESPTYDIGGTIENYEAGKLDKAQFYQASLDILSALNPDRVFLISLDLKEAFLGWKAKVQKFSAKYKGDPSDRELIKQYLFHSDDTLVLTNELLFGRINSVFLSEDQKDGLVEIVAHVLSDPEEERTFLRLARDYFSNVTEDKYAVQTVLEGRWVPALQCEDAADKCLLRYPEFTAIYPNGSVIGSTQDRDGNTIHAIRNNALMTFLERRYHDVDHIRSQPYYGYAPKMDWQAIGNGIHNPGVSHYLAGARNLYEELDIPEEYQFLWVVSRGPVSHGCVRMSVGHLWEVRQIFPASPERLKEVLYFGNRSADYDVFDIDGNGTPEVMGSQYYLAYSVQGASGDARRKGKNFTLANVTKEDFFRNLYGEKGQYERHGEDYVFPNPYVSHFRKTNETDKQGAVISRSLPGSFKLYEQPYEKDKVQIYRLPPTFQKQLSIKDNFKSTGKQMVRVFGRISACGPFGNEWSNCYEQQFDEEFEALSAQL